MLNPRHNILGVKVFLEKLTPYSYIGRIMRLLTRTVSRHPWTRGEIGTDLKAVHASSRWWTLTKAIHHSGSHGIGLVGSLVLVDDAVFPNFKEEINV